MVNLFRYGFFSFPAAISLLIMQVYIPSYIAQLGLFDLTSIGIVFFGARLVDMISDLLIGYASDRTSPKYGRRKIWILLGTPIFLLVFYQLLAIPQSLGALFVVAAFWYIAGTCLIVPYYTWGAEIEKGYHNHTKYTGARVVFGLLGSLCALIVPAIIMPEAPLEDILDFNFKLISSFFIIAILLLLSLPDKSTINTEDTRLRDIVGIFKKGSCFNQLIISQLFNGIANALPATLFIFFATYVLKRPDLTGLLLVVYFLAAAISVPLWVKAASIWRKERCWQVAMCLASFTFLGVVFVDEHALTLFFSITVITGLMAGADLSIPASMLADIIDQDGTQNNRRRPGIYFAVWGTTSKLTLAFAVIIAFSLLGMEVFKPDQQSTLIDTKWLTILYAFLPAMFKIISVLLLSGYKLKTDKRLN
ncbi:MAG: MFS transporter [Emcibacteraceae bacterium]|nr:MFS transporter [Emcibacteraceae bacterium]